MNGFGFENHYIEGVGDHEGSKIVYILKVNSQKSYVNCDIISGSYINSYQKPVLCSFYPIYPPGYKIIELPKSHT